jgi:hypothetical protein
MIKLLEEVMGMMTFFGNHEIVSKCYNIGMNPMLDRCTNCLVRVVTR